MLISKEKIYSSALSLYLLFKFGIFNQVISAVIIALIFLFLSIVLVNQKYTFTELLSLILLLLIFAVSGLRSGDGNFIFVLAFIFASKDIDIKKIIRLFLTMYLLYFIYMFLRNVFGIENSNYSTKYVDGVLTFVKNYGFGHPNQLSIRFSIFILMFLYIKRGTMKWFCFVAILVAGIGVYGLTRSKTGLSILIISILFTLFLKKKNMQRFVCIMLFPISALATILSVLFPIIYNSANHYLYIINNQLTGRLRLGNQFFGRYGITPFGQDLDFSGYDNVLDSLYPFVLLQYGVVTFLVITILTILLLYKLLRSKFYYEAVLIQMFLIIGISELTPINLSYNFTLLFFSLILNSKDRKDKVT